MSRFDETWHRLQGWTSGQAPSERLAAQLIQAEGYRDVDPTHPLGGKDGGKDALATRKGKTWVMAAYFPRGPQSYATIQDKVVDDYKGVGKNGADGMVFVTNQEVRAAERKALENAVSGELDLFHVERNTAILDRPEMAQVREQFLQIPAGGIRSRAARLDESLRASVARCRERWMAVGIGGDQATTLAADRTLGAPQLDLRPTPTSPLAVWTAEFGTGKSIAAERFHQDSIDAAVTDPASPVPVFLHASQAAEGTQRAVAEASEGIGNPHIVGATIVIDGVDEIGLEAANQLLSQARVLTATWPATTILLTSRPLPALTEAEEHRTLPPLSEDDQVRCIELGAGGPAPAHWLKLLPPQVRELLRRPMFALLAGVWLRKHSGVPRAPIDLLTLLGERILVQDNLQAQLRELAVASIRRALAPVPRAAIRENTDALLATGLLVKRGEGVTFGLPAVAQWFAAQAILHGEHDVEAITDARDDLQLWLYPFALALSVASDAESDALMAPLLEGVPGFAAQVLKLAFSQVTFEGGAAPPWREAGRRLRHTYESLARSLGDATSLTGRVTASGALPPLAVATSEDRVEIAFYQGRGSRQDVFALPADFNILDASIEWGPAKFGNVGPNAAWAWRWARDDFRGDLHRLIQGRGLPIPDDGPLAHEAVWEFMCRQANQPLLLTETLAIEPALSFLEHALEASSGEPVTILFDAGRPTHSAIPIHRYLSKLVDAGEPAVNAPFPPADIRQPASGVIGNFYSETRLVETASSLYRQAIEAFRQLVDRWFAPLAPDLEHRVLMPFRMVANLNPGLANEFGPIPTLAGHLECLPAGSTDEVAVTIDHDSYGFNVDPSVWQAQRELRPDAARWLTGGHGGFNFELGSATATTDAVYHWLARDLERLGLVKAMAWSESRRQVRWESDGER